MGTAELGRPSLDRLMASSEWRLRAVITQPDRPKGRHLKLQPSPIKEQALQLGLPILQPEKCRSESFLDELRAFDPDLVVVVAYGQILPKTLLEIPRLGCLNVHASLLPKYRGAAPIQWAILNDEAETGVTIMQMDPGLDTGPILAQEKTPINESDNAQTLHDRLAQIGGRLLLETIPGYVSAAVPPRPQPSEGASYARKITKEDGLLVWEQPARALWNRFRALSPWPGVFTFFKDGQRVARLKVWSAEIVPEISGNPGEVLFAGPEGIVVATGDAALRLQSVQKEGGRVLTAREFLAGHRVRPGEKFGIDPGAPLLA